MTLTHDKVRALRDATTTRASCVTCEALLMPDRVSAPHCEDCSVSDEAEAEWEQLGFDDRDHGDVVRALCDEWLARNAARWDEEEPETLRCNEWFGHVRRSRHGLGYAWFAFSPDDESSPLATEADARAWLEGRAREAGFEVAT